MIYSNPQTKIAASVDHQSLKSYLAFASSKYQTPQLWRKHSLCLTRHQKFATSLSIKMLSRLCASTTVSLSSLSQSSQLSGHISAARKHVHMIPLSSCCRVGSASKLYKLRSGWHGDKDLSGQIRLERLRSSGTGWGGSAQLEPLDLTEENVEQVLLDARSELLQIFDTSVGITGVAELVELDGPFVKLRLTGRFWHERSMVLARLANYLQKRIPAINAVYADELAQWRDSFPVAEYIYEQPTADGI